MKDTEPSYTAFMLAVSQVLLHTHPEERNRRLVNDEMATMSQWFVDECAHQTADPKFDASQYTVESVNQDYTNLVQVDILRKHVFEKNIRKAIADGATQVVILGGGFDTLVMRLRKHFPEVQFFEIDHPSTSVVKKAVIEKKKAEYPDIDGPNAHYIAADFEKTSLKELLEKEKSFKPDSKTAFMAEGVLFYLRESTVRGILTDINTLGGLGSQVIVETLDAINSSAQDQQLAADVASVGEDQRWALDPAQAKRFFEMYGLSTRDVNDHRDRQVGFATDAEMASVRQQEGAKTYTLELTSKLGRLSHYERPDRTAAWDASR